MMKFKILLVLSTIGFLASCHGQPTYQAFNKGIKDEPMAIGDTVNQTGNNIMVVYHDRKNNYWFGSWEEGVYHYDEATYNAGVWKFDGAKITHYPVQVNSKNITLFSIYNDNNGNLWLGSHENGTFKFNGLNFERFEL